MKYLLIKLFLWFKYFGFRGLSIVARRNLNTLEDLALSSAAYGTIYFRNCRSDIEAVNTVLCFEAYKASQGLDRCRTIIDLGGNIGMASRYLRVRVPDAKIIALEPAPSNVSLFRRNLRTELENGMITLITAAVGAKTGTGFLTTPGENQFDAYQVSTSNDISQPESAIPIIAMREICEQCEVPTGVKMDIEGGEIGLLETREEWIKKVEYLMIEFHNHDQEKRWLQILRQEGWKVQKQFDTWHFSR